MRGSNARALCLAPSASTTPPPLTSAPHPTSLRLANILGLYADGVGILHELLQNADDGVFVCELEPAETPYRIMPYLADPRAALDAHPNLAYRVSVYADQPFSLGAAEHVCGGDTCDYDCKNCPMYNIYERLKRMEVGLDRQLKYLGSLQPIGDLEDHTILSRPS